MKDWVAFSLAMLGTFATQASACAGEPDAALRKAVSLYASFDDAVRGDFGGGALDLATRFNHPTEKGELVSENGCDGKVFRIANGKDKSGGALEVVDVLPRNGRLFSLSQGNMA